MDNRIKPVKLVIIFLVYLTLFPGCDQKERNNQTRSDVITLHVWAHAGQESERNILLDQVKRFNLQTNNINVKLTFIPERDYNAQIQATALADDLPDLLEFDGPYLYNYIWQDHLIPLETLLAKEVMDDLLPSIIDQGTHGQHLYSVGIFDSGLGLYANKSKLTAINARLPKTASDAWSIKEFNTLLKQLSKHDEDKAVLDLKLNYSGEWFTYGFSPLIQSSGADLINREDYQTSHNILNSAAAVDAMQQLGNWIQHGYVDPNLDDAAFISGRVALSWVGHWEYSRYNKALKDELLVLPLPDFGKGSRTGQGSWNWGVTKMSRSPEAAADFLHFLLRTDEVLAMSNANSAVPGTKSAVSQSALYGEKGPLRLFANQLMQGVSVARPKTPAYPVITTEFQNAFQQVRNGGNVKQALDNAANKIDQDIRDNKGYPFYYKKVITK
jgi:multiple sugar transport system substrate-binding protein